MSRAKPVNHMIVRDTLRNGYGSEHGQKNYIQDHFHRVANVEMIFQKSD